jgi:nitroimidazol reductase NimA-like FMN-containing flavoprotein (pyridoxamine 5'-phosphate oxidase superfamily)
MTSVDQPRRGAVELLRDRQQMEVIADDECRQLLQENEIGRVGFVQSRQVVMLPVNYTFVSGSVLFRTATGSKLYIASMRRPASFEIDGWDSENRTGWSVLLKGVSEYANETWLASALDSLNTETWAAVVRRDNWVRIRGVEITGRRIVPNPYWRSQFVRH